MMNTSAEAFQASIPDIPHSHTTFAIGLAMPELGRTANRQIVNDSPGDGEVNAFSIRNGERDGRGIPIGMVEREATGFPETSPAGEMRRVAVFQW
ncbi:hypothetical protein ABIC44_002590 [Sphingomonas sp. 1185]